MGSTHLETEGPTERKQGQILITDFTSWTKLKTIQNTLRISLTILTTS